MDKVLILFSGGTDSTAAAVYYLQKGHNTHLVTFDNGAEKNLDKSEKRANLIKQQFGEHCSWQLLSCTLLFHEVAIKTLEQDVKEYGNLICCGCKLSMLAEAIIYCRKNGITIIADGFKKDQDYYPEQTPEYISTADSFAKEFNISYTHPVYEADSTQIEDLNISGILNEPLQPECLFGLNRVRNKNIKKYTQDKLPVVRNYINKFPEDKPA